MFLLNDTTYSLKPTLPGLPVNKVEAGFYTMFATPVGIMWKPIAPFEINHKVYGSAIKMAPRIIESYKQRTGKITTALFSGLKGSGKSLLMKRIAIDFVAQGGVVVTINDAFSGVEFNSIIEALANQEVMFIIDEFEKTYSSKAERNSILSLLDGTVSAHALFVLTSNEKLRGYNSSLEFFHNRPSRVYYSLEFNSVDLEAISEFIDDVLVDTSRKNEILDFIDLFREFNMDMLSILLKEVNSTPDLSVKQLASFLNIKPDTNMSRLEFKWTAKFKDPEDPKAESRDITGFTRGLSPSRLGDFLENGETINVMVDRVAFMDDIVEDENETPMSYRDRRQKDLETRQPYDQYWNPENAEMTQLSPDQFEIAKDGITISVTVRRPKYRTTTPFSFL